eukprot:3550810-Prymnesium_polylepis.2
MFAAVGSLSIVAVWVLMKICRFGGRVEQLDRRGKQLVCVCVRVCARWGSRYAATKIFHTALFLHSDACDA